MKRKRKEKQNPKAYECRHCFNYEWIDDEMGYQCSFPFNPPCQDAMLATDK